MSTQREKLEKAYKVQRILSEKGGPVGFGDETTPASEGAEPRINVRGKRRSINLGPIKRLFAPHATVYSSLEGETAVPGKHRGLGVIGISLMKALGASRDLISAVKRAHREDTKQATERVGRINKPKN